MTPVAQQTRLHSWKRIACPECQSKALRPVIDESKPQGVDILRGYCYSCRRSIGAGPRYKSAAERVVILDRLHRKMTSNGIALKNGLSTFLLERYGPDISSHLRLWDVGTDTIGNAVYWYRDIDGELQTAKVVGYNSKTGKRLKKEDSSIRWMQNGQLAQTDAIFGVARELSKAGDGCAEYEWMTSKRGYRRPLYGSQFLGQSRLDVPVLLVEAEKTAVIASMFLRSFVFVASGGAGGLTMESAAALAGRDVFVMLDADDAGRKAVDDVVDVLCRVGARPVVDVEGLPLVDYLMPDAPKGFDLADYFLAQDDLLPDLTIRVEDLPDLTVNVEDLPDLTVKIDDLPDLTVNVDNCGIPQLEDADEFDEIWSRDNALDIIQNELPELPNIDTDVHAVRSMLLRAYGRDRVLTERELYRRIWSKRLAGGSLLRTYGTIHKLLKLGIYDTSAQVFHVHLLESAR